MKNQILTISSILFLSFLISCKSDNQVSNAKEQTINKIESKSFTLTPFTKSPNFPDARLASMDYSAGTFDFGIEGNSYSLGSQTTDAPQKMCANSAKGQHIHLIVDNGPYAAKYVSNFEHEVADGEHYILAFLSRSYHESIKTDAANILQKVQVKNGGITASEDVTEEMLLYSRPKGAYTGDDTKKVMLDFYLKNTEISEAGNYVEADINGEIHKITSWQPYYIENLPDGDNTIKLTLKDQSGQMVKAPLNPVTRTFKVQSDPVSNN